MKRRNKGGKSKHYHKLTNQPILKEKTMSAVHGATVTCPVNPGDFSTTVKFVYGTDTNFGFEVEFPDPIILPEDVTADLTELEAETTYFVKLVASYSLGTKESAVVQFTTPADVPVPVEPVVGEVAVTSIF
jgi:hypothetical protein